MSYYSDPYPPEDEEVAPVAPVASERVAIPTNADQAALMCLLGRQWLEQNAPERLVAPVASEEVEAMCQSLCDVADDLGVGSHSDVLLEAAALIRKQAVEIDDLRMGRAEYDKAYVAMQAQIAELQKDAERYQSALERARHCIQLLIAGKPVRDVTETFAEIDAAIACWQGGRRDSIGLLVSTAP